MAKKSKCEECGIFKPTKNRVITFVVLGLIGLAGAPLQRQLLENYKGTTVGKVVGLVGITGNGILAISAIIGFYGLVCIALYYIFKKK